MSIYPTHLEFRNGKETGKVSVDTDDLTSLLQRTYKVLAPVENQWHGRNTIEGQTLLNELCDSIARLTRRSSRDVQENGG